MKDRKKCQHEQQHPTHQEHPAAAYQIRINRIAVHNRTYQVHAACPRLVTVVLPFKLLYRARTSFAEFILPRVVSLGSCSASSTCAIHDSTATSTPAESSAAIISTNSSTLTADAFIENLTKCFYRT